MSLVFYSPELDEFLLYDGHHQSHLYDITQTSHRFSHSEEILMNEYKLNEFTWIFVGFL